MGQQPSDKLQRDDGRPDPDALLKRYNLRDSDVDAEASSSTESSGAGHKNQSLRRGRLRVYLGAVAGSGKTYAMLNEGHRRESRGTDVVVGYVETHGRSQTQAQIGDLEIVPRKKFTYRCDTVEEMETEAIKCTHPKDTLIE